MVGPRPVRRAGHAHATIYNWINRGWITVRYTPEARTGSLPQTTSRSANAEPPGLESNWIKTVDQDGWFVLFRLYAPTEPFFDRTWALPDFERVTP